MLNAKLFTLWLALAPPNNATDQAFAELERATTTLGEVDPKQSIELLERSIAAAGQEPRALLDDPRLGDALFQARVALVRAHLASEDRAGAIRAMDEVVRSSGGQALPSGLGPEVERLYADQMAAAKQAGEAQIVVECKLPCEVLVNERRSGDWVGTRVTLPLGNHRVWMLPEVGGVEPRHEEVVLDTAGEEVVLTYKAPPAFEAKAGDPSTNTLSVADERKKIRKMKTVGGVLIGLTALTLPVAITGIGFLAYSGSSSCVGLDCIFGIFVGELLLVGGMVGTLGLLVPGSIVLSVGMQKERRLGLRVGLPTFTLTPRTAGVGWAFRF